MSTRALERAVVSWNRSRLELESDEVLAQILDRGDLAAWRELYALAASDPRLRRRILEVLSRAAAALSLLLARGDGEPRRDGGLVGARSIRPGNRLIGESYFQVSVLVSVSFFGAVSVAWATQEVVPSFQVPLVSATCARC